MLFSFDQGKPLIGIDNKRKLTPTQKARKKQKERIDQEKDEDIKRELMKGNIVDQNMKQRLKIKQPR